MMVEEIVEEKSKTLGIIGIIFGVVFPIVGFILGVIGAAKDDSDTALSITAIGVSVAAWIVWTLSILGSM